MKFCILSGATFYDLLIPYINLLNLSWIIKCLFLRNMEPLTLDPKTKLPKDVRSLMILLNVELQICPRMDFLQTAHYYLHKAHNKE